MDIPPFNVGSSSLTCVFMFKVCPEFQSRVHGTRHTDNCAVVWLYLHKHKHTPRLILRTYTKRQWCVNTHVEFFSFTLVCALTAPRVLHLFPSDEDLRG